MLEQEALLIVQGLLLNDSLSKEAYYLTKETCYISKETYLCILTFTHLLLL
jgi:hypothetical protein